MKFLKKAIPLCLLALALVIAITLLTPKAEATTVSSGTCGENLSWTLDNTGTLTISGTGAMTDYDTDWDSPTGSTHPWGSVANAIHTVNIENGVTSIGAFAFYGCPNLTYVTVPDSVTGIGEWAFYNCDSLYSVALSPYVATIGGWAFYDCDSLTGIWVDMDNPYYKCDAQGVLFNKEGTKLIQAPGGLAGEYAIPEGVITLGSESFCNCDSLQRVTIPGSVTTIGSGAFAGCDLLWNIVIPDSVTSIQIEAFSDCVSLNSVTIGNGVTAFGYYTFSGCTDLRSVTVGNSVREITDSAFTDCTALETVTLPESLTTVGDHVFYNCDSLATVYYLGTKDQWSQITVSEGNDPLLKADLVWKEIETKVSDLNDDARTDNQDVLLLLWHVLFPEKNPVEGNVDYNEDALVDNADVLLLLWHVLFPAQNPL